MDQVRFGLHEQGGILQEEELDEELRLREEEQLVFLHQVVLDGGDHRQAQEGVLAFDTAVEAGFLGSEADVLGLQLQAVDVGVLVHQHLAQGQTQPGHGLHAFGEGVLEGVGSRRGGDGDLLAGGVVLDDLVEGIDELAVLFLLDHLDLVFLQPVGDGHADGHQLELGLGDALGLDLAEGDAEALAVEVTAFARTLERHEGGLGGIRFDFTDDGGLVVSADTVGFHDGIQLVGGHGARFEQAAQDAVFVQLLADIQRGVLHGLLDLAIEDLVAERAVEQLGAHFGGLDIHGVAPLA